MSRQAFYDTHLPHSRLSGECQLEVFNEGLQVLRVRLSQSHNAERVNDFETAGV